MKLILASESPYRKELLERLNLSFITSPAHINEEDIWQTDLTPLEVSIELAKRKAKKVSELYPDDVIIGSDQVISLDNYIFGKPKTRDKAIQQLIQLRGKTHQLMTSVCLLGQGKEIIFSNTTELLIRHDLTETDLEKYVDYDQPLNCAGSYKIEGMGIALFEKVETSDFTSIIGLPLMETAKQLEHFGFKVFK